jgi:hypothetical protein
VIDDRVNLAVRDVFGKYASEIGADTQFLTDEKFASDVLVACQADYEIRSGRRRGCHHHELGNRVHRGPRHRSRYGGTAPDSSDSAIDRIPIFPNGSRVGEAQPSGRCCYLFRCPVQQPMRDRLDIFMSFN